MNFGVFSMPFTFSQCGLMAISISVLAVGICTYTAKLLTEAIAEKVEQGEQPTELTLATEAVGPRFGRLLQFLMPFECFVYGFGNVVCVSQTLSPLIGVDVNVVAVGSVVLAMPLMTIPNKAYSYVSLLAGASVIVVMCLIVAFGAGLPEWAQGSEVLVSGVQLSRGFSLNMFCIAGHCIIPSTYASMGGRDNVVKSYSYGVAVWLCCALAFGVAGYYIFGESSQVLAIENVGRDIDMNPYPVSFAMRLAFPVMLLLKCQLCLVPVGRPVASLFNRVMGISTDVCAGGWEGFRSGVPGTLCLLPAAVAFMTAMDFVDGITGSVVMSMNALVFPGLAYLKICKPTGFSRLGAQAVVAFGVLFSVIMGTDFLATYCVARANTAGTRTPWIMHTLGVTISI